jgi:hypothetical protein
MDLQTVTHAPPGTRPPSEGTHAKVERIRREVSRRCRNSGQPQVVIHTGTGLRFISASCERGQRALEEQLERVVGVYQARWPQDLSADQLADDLQAAAAC